MVKVPIVYRWGTTDEPIDCDSMIEIADWAKNFSGINRLPKDVRFPLERCCIGAYQVGYLYDYQVLTDKDAKQSYYEEGIASILLHTIAAYEMTEREFINFRSHFKDFDYKWSKLSDRNVYKIEDTDVAIMMISEGMFKFMRWMVYHHMHRTKRWNEEEFKDSLGTIMSGCFYLVKHYSLNLARGFALCMSKIQDAEINRH